MTAIVVLALITSVAVIGYQPADDPGSSEGVAAASEGGAGPMNVTDIRLQDRSDGILTYDIEFKGDFAKGYLQNALMRTFDSKHVRASSIRLQNVSSNVATVEVATNGKENTATVSDRMLRSMQLNESKTPAGESENDTPGYGVPEEGVAYYQIDFVQGEPIHNLGDNGTYQPDELIRYAHGSSEDLIKRSSYGEFTTDETLSEAVESSSILVKSDGTARVSFRIKENAEPVTLSLVSYTKPGPIWTRASEDQQEFVDADTRTFEPGGTYTLRVDLPTVENDTTTDSAGAGDSTAAESDAGGAADESTMSSSDSESGSASTATSTSSSTGAGSDEVETSDASATTSTSSGETATATETVEVEPNPTPSLTPTPTPMPEVASSSARSGTSSASTGGASTPSSTPTNDDRSTSSESERSSSSTESDTDSTTEERSSNTGSSDAPSSSTPDTTSPADDSATTDEQAGGSPATETESESGDSLTSTEASATDGPADDTTSAPEPTTDESGEQPSTDQPTSTTDSPDTDTEEPTTETTTEADETATSTEQPTTDEPTTTDTETEETPTSTESPTTETPTEEPTTTTTETQTETEEPTTTAETETETEQPETETETSTPTETETDTATPTETTIVTATPTPEPTDEPATETETETETETPTPTTTPEPTESGAEISFNEQSLEEALRVVVESATITDENGGFVVVYDAGSFDEIDRPDDRIGISNRLSKGTTESINIDLQFGEAVANERLTAVVVNDTNGNGRYDPGVDMGALTMSGEIATDSANVAIAVGLLPGGPGDTPAGENESDGNGSSGNGSDSGAPTENESDGNGSGDDDGGGILDVAATSEGSEATESETTTIEEPAARDTETTSADDGNANESETPSAAATVNEAMAVSEATAPE